MTDWYTAKVTGPHPGLWLHRYSIEYSLGDATLRPLDHATTRDRAYRKAAKRTREWNRTRGALLTPYKETDE